MDKERRLIRFSGDVQGVGFRYTACRVADQHGVTGWVRNLPDGAVECVAEGAPAGLDAFVEDLRERFSGCMRGISQQAAPHTGEFVSFGVKY
jgi:acylphosphatase